MSFVSVQSVFSQFGKEKKNIKDRWAKGKQISVWGQIMGVP